jgi:sugar phosphate permease
MRRLSDHDLPRTWGPQSTAIPVGGTIAWMVGVIALLFGVASEVPEVRAWAIFALPASLVISFGYIVVRRWRSRPPTTLNLNGTADAGRVEKEPASPRKGPPKSQPPFHHAVASC